jgi:Acetyltransferase (GNAT) domain
MKNLQIDCVSNSEALVFWNTSPHATAFTRPETLEALAHKVDWWIVRKGDKPMCLWPICTNNKGAVYLPNFTYSVGPMLSAEALATPLHRRFSYDLTVFEALLEKLTLTYGELRASLPIGLDDVRAFEWWNYHEPHKGRLQIAPRYTAVIDQLQARSIDEVTSAYREVRRQELRKAERREDLIVSASCRAEEIISIYSNTMNRQNGTTGDQNAEDITKLVEIADRGGGYVIALRTTSGSVAQVVLVLDAKGKANLVLNNASETFRTQAIAARLVTLAIAQARQRGNTVFDFNGANSPRRGDDKHSYGARAQLYFDIASR